MTTATAARSAKTHRDENFPVASWLLGRRYRRPILAFYRFARAADDVADHPTLQPNDKLCLLDRLDEALSGKGPSDPEAEPLRIALRDYGLAPRHAFDLLEAFRLDVRKHRYASWQDLMEYCRLSAMPVGRFVLDVHGEDRACWQASDSLCAALQVINHLQDCARDYRRLDRVYLPLDMLAAHGAAPEMLAESRSTPALLSAIRELARQNSALLRDAASLSRQVSHVRLSLEIAAIHTLAEHLVHRLTTRDPLSERVHLGRLGFAAIGGRGIVWRVAAIFSRSLTARRDIRP